VGAGDLEQGGGAWAGGDGLGQGEELGVGEVRGEGVAGDGAFVEGDDLAALVGGLR